MSIETTLDPVTYEVVSHRLYSINEEGATTIVHASGSPVVHATDYNFAIYTADGEIAVTGVFYMLPLFVMQLLIKHVLATVPLEELKPGDVFVSNDPFECGVHQSDVQFVSPFFHDGQLVGWTGCMAHVMDLGGMFPGSWCPTATDVFQEGLRIPLGRIAEGGVINRQLWDMILANSRLPAMVANDFSAFLSAHRVSQERLKEACDTYGADAIVATMAMSLDRTERQMRAWVSELPDGEFEHVGFVDHDGHENRLYRVQCRLTKAGDHLTFDFTGTDPAIVGMGNATKSGTFGAIATVVIGIFGSRLPWNAGLFRHLTVITEPNSVVSAEPPSPVSAGSVTGAWVANGAAAICAAKMLGFAPEYDDYICGPADGSWILVQFGGVNQYEEPFATMVMDSLGWGGAAFNFRDGVDVGGSLICLGGGFNDVELEESNNPLLWLWRREAVDSGGAGRFRGGNGIEFALAPHNTAELQMICGTQGVVVPGLLGMYGALPGGTSEYSIVQESDWVDRLASGNTISSLDELSGNASIPEAKFSMSLRSGDVINNVTQNGGGFGDPLERDPAAVLADHLAGKVSADFAASAYGVVVAGDAVNEAATERRRAEAREARLSSLQNHDGEYAIDRELPAVRTWGGIIDIVERDGQHLIRATESGAILGPLGENWRDVCPWREVTQDELGTRVRVDERLELRQYVDPVTGRSLLVDLIRRGDPIVTDFRLADLG